MIGRLIALILLSTVSQTIDVPHQLPLTVAELGGNLTLTCPLSRDEAGLFYWYKLKFGFMVQTVAAGTLYKITLQGQFNNSRFAVKKVNTLYYLNITNVRKEDEATYFCQTGAAYLMKFMNGTVLAVNDHKNLQKSDYVKQRPETASVQLGDTVTLQCSLLSKNKENPDQCPGEHNVYWFRAGSGESHPSIIYTQSNSSDKDKERSCVYTQNKTIRNSSDAGTYYCAVFICGEILFGEGTKVETRQELCPFVIVLGTLLACCVTVIVALIISRKQKPVCEHCKVTGEVSASSHTEHNRSAEDQLSNVDGASPLNYVALDFPSRKARRWMNNRELPQNSLYSEMRDYK